MKRKPHGNTGKKNALKRPEDRKKRVNFTFAMTDLELAAKIKAIKGYGKVTESLWRAHLENS